MISKIKLENFKCFVEADIDIAPMTLLAGLNSSGKSSIIQALRIANNGKLLQGYGECVNVDAKIAKIEITNKGKQYEIQITKQGKPQSKNFIENKEFQYIGADRLGPQVQLPFRRGDIYSVGEQGEDVLSYINEYYEESGVPEKLRMRGYESLSSVKEQIQAWLNIISPEFKFSFLSSKETDTAFSQYNNFRAKDVGFGLSYTLPIIAAVIISAYKLQKNKIMVPVIMIENPEAHLHPSGQTKLGKFLALAASCGVQIIAETHSDHFLNGVRLAAKEEDIDFKDIVIQYMKYNVKEKTSENIPIYVDEYGMLDEWPEGFFDQNEKNLLELL